MKNQKLVSVIVPAYNEEQLIFKFLEDITKTLQSFDLNYEVLIVENGSIDKTAELVESFIKKHKFPVKLIKCKEAGYGLALIRGVKESKGDIAVILNVDFWDPKFLQITQADLLGFDIVASSKLLPGSKDRRGPSRRLVTLLYNKFLNIFLGYSGTDTHGIKVFRLSKINPVIAECKTRSGIFDSELMVRADRHNLKILELPVDLKELRPARFSYTRWFNTPKDIWKLYQVLKDK